MITYVAPELPPGTPVAKLQPTDLPANELTPERQVLVFNRGPEVLLCQFDGRHYEFPPGWSELRYDAAAHCQQRLVVPGSRDPDNPGVYQSYLVIAGIDNAVNALSRCVPFNQAERKQFGLKTEGLDRSAVEARTFSKSKKIDVKKNAGRLPQSIRAQGKRPQHDLREQGTEAAARAAETAFQKPERSDAERDAAAATGRERGA